MPKYFRYLLFSTVFSTGAAVLIFEVTAVRALSPFFGSSIYVVSSVLTVILAALSLGYYYGGRLADHKPDVRILYLIISSAGLIMNVLYMFSLFFFPIAGILLPITYGPLIMSLCFFFFPAFLLGIDSPFVIKLLTRSGDDKHNGAIVGSTFFWSTIGSIVGSLTSGFILIPFVGVQLTFLGTATALSVLSCIAYIALLSHNKKLDSSRLLFWMFIITASSVITAALTTRTELFSTHPGEILFHSDGYYSQIEVIEQELEPNKTIRSLIREINHSSAIEMGTTTFVFPYTEFSRAYKYLRNDAGTFLLIGGGAYTVPRTLLHEDKNLDIDVVEIEPSLFELAQTYFELPDSPRLHNHVMDARTYLLTNNKKYDVIYIDAYQSGHFIPPHLTTKEFFTSVRDHLTPEGVLMINIIGKADHNEKTLIGSIVKTIKSEFPNLQMYEASTHLSKPHNIAAIAKNSDSPFVLPDDFVIDLKNGSSTPANDRMISLQRFHLDKQVVFTDDLAPVELLVAKQILEYQ